MGCETPQATVPQDCASQPARPPEREWSSLLHGATSRDADAGRSNVFIISFHSVTRSSFALSNANMYTRVRVCTAVHIYAHSSAPTPVPRRAAGADCVQDTDTHSAWNTEGT